ncbi:hypothetical protein MMC22_006056 [Lobaria immixta]|nr:hypothetical protein [Lobaria immixta]
MLTEPAVLDLHNCSLQTDIPSVGQISGAVLGKGYGLVFGRFVRFGPNSLSVNSNTALRDIYGFKSNVRKADFYSVFPPTKDTFNTHSSIDKASHARKRRVLAHAFSEAALKSMEKYMLTNERLFLERLCPQPNTEKAAAKKPTEWSVALNMADWANYLTFDIMGDLAFGQTFGLLERSDNRFAIDLIGNAAHRHLICGMLPMIHELHLDKILFPKIAAGRDRYMAFSRSQAAERMKTGLDTDRKDFFHYLLHAKDPDTGKGFTTSELRGESNLLIIAGSDTTSTALASTFFYLTHNPHAYEKVVQEVRRNFTELKQIHSGSVLNSCVYLHACIDEALRLSPPVGNILPRQVLHGGTTLDGDHIPEGIVVATPHYTLHHNAEYFPEPFEYRPERWIVDSPRVTEHDVAVAHSAFCPFSLGPRACIGRAMAYMELRTTIARTLFMYDMRLASGTTLGEGRPDLERGRQRVGEYQLKDTFTSMKDGPMVEFRMRD